MTESFMDWPLSKFHEMEDKKMTKQILDVKQQAAAIDVVFKLEAECRKRGQEIERQAAEILELTTRLEMQAETISRMKRDLEMHQDRY